ncbi:hypothetical protein Asulf_01507 [Archaeoglobus sulfaticallidus PM70-1]|uniref:Terminase large subunit gp17-like C-terminal domain-containing protein n=1 Tax=Archaeoglobus sulfaticallidus PM70-1 TaxID=387631 RepID=N0BMK9_9EURY|nr:terminase family protein [Archaeoglobus sulfaticallidus]AGK61490.1 hypothetical protein Asulf_01507 [Archaeoglobus sulfaticallidus PM70-1]
MNELISELGKDRKKLKQAIRDPVLFTQIFLNHEPHEAQKQILRDRHQFKTIVAGRRFGKTKAMAFSTIHYAITHPGSIQFILAPSYNQANIMFWEITTLLSKSILVHLVERVYKTPFSKIIFKNGSEIHARSTTKPEYLRGHKAHRVILDEAAYIPDDVISQVVEPMLADYNGSWIKIGTPFGKNHFYDTYLKGQSEGFPDYSSYRFPSTANPHISHEFIEKKKREYGENSIIFRTEYLAEFIEDQNAVFKWADIQKNIAGIQLIDKGISGRRYVIGVDLAKYMDYTVIVVLDVTEKPYRLIYFERYNRRPYAETIFRIKDLHKRFNLARVLIDSSGVGDPVLEDLQGIGAEGYVFTSKSKVQLINRLVAAMENGEVKYPYIEDLIKELQFFEYQLTRTGIKMGARQGFNDDCVIALALAVWIAEQHSHKVLRRVYGATG